MKTTTCFRAYFVALILSIFLFPLTSTAQVCVNTINTYPYSESFEGTGTGGFGVWVQDATDNGDWATVTGQTPSGGTGPLNASNLNYYIYTEATTGYFPTAPGNPNRTAFLNSPCFNLTGLTTPQFSFDYHMFGSNMGTLKIQVSTDNGASWADIGWTRTGQQHASGGAAWLGATVDLTPYAGSTIKLRFHGTTGNGYQSDMSVDNVNVIDTSAGATCTSTVNTFPYAEGFEGTGSGGLGAWIQATGDNGDWTNTSGGTPSGNTGPSAANEGSYYMFTEASSGGSPGSPTQTAFLDSPCFDLTGLTNPEFSFSYHMYGANMGTLKIQVSTDNGASFTDIGWSLTGQQHTGHTDPWSSATINLSAYIGQTIVLRFHGTTGSDYRSDMAIDGVSLIDLVPQPEMNVQGNGNSIADGDTTPSVTDATDFGNVETGGPTGTSTFVIQNTGVLTLNLTGASPYVTIGGANAGDFAVTTIPANSIAASGSTTFVITFTPGALGLRTATLSIANDDSDENPYNYSIQGTGILPITGSKNTTIYYENFDANNGGWVPTNTSGTTTWAYDTGTTLVAEAGYWRTNPWGNYSTNSIAFLTSPSAIATTGYQNVTFYLDIRYDTDNDPDDGAQIEYTTNVTGTGGWTRLGSNGQGTNWYNDTDVDGIANGEHGWTGRNTENTSSNSKFLEASLPNAVLDNQAVLWFRVRFGSDGSNTDGGVAIDNIIIKGDPIVAPPDPALGPGDVTEDLRLWLKSNNSTSTTTDNTALSSWGDQAYNNHAVAYSTYRPLYKDNATDNLNHNPAIEFNRASQHHMKGKGGYHSQDYFIVLKPNEPIDNTGSYRQQPMAGKYSADGFSVDGTGIGFGFISSRYTDAVIAHTISSYPQSGGPNATSYGRAYASSTTTIDEDIMILNIKTNPTDSSTEIYLNGVKIDNQTGQAGNGADLNFNEIDNLVYYLGVGRFTMNGYNPAINSYFDGRIAEVISYSTRRTTTEQHRIQSYLALKYGLTLLSSTNTVGTTETDVDYVNSAGTVIWDTSANSGFNYDIAGIGRDDDSGLNQKQSSSINGDVDGTGPIEGLLTVGLTDIYDTNNENIALNGANTFSDQQFLIWGNNGADITLAPFTVNVDMSAGIAGLSTPVTFDGMQRIWKFNEVNGDVGSVKVSIPQNAVRNISPPGSYLMFISNTTVFDPTADYRVMIPDGSGNLEAEYDFDGTKYVTFGYAPQVVVERSVYFDGTNDYIDVGNHKDLNPGGFAVSAWIKREAGSTDKSILSKRDAAYTQGYDFKITSTGQVEMSWVNGSVQTITGTTFIPESEWHHVAVIYNGGTANLYIDGVLDQTAALSPPVSNTESFIIAAAGKTATTDLFIGNIDEVRVWDIALSVDQLHYIMNQEIEDNATFVDGMELPTAITKNEVASIPWSDLSGYYPMSIYTYTNTNDHADGQNQGALRNLNTVDFQTAPLPYESDANGNWDASATWLNGAVNRIPGSTSIADANTSVDWNIIKINHDIRVDNYTTVPASNNLNRSVLGLMVESNELTVGASPYDATAGFGITVTHYLELDGSIDLEGESQLVQTDGSDLDVTSSGSLERDQQGTSDTYTYNYWSSPVGTINTTANNQGYTIPSMMRDGTTPLAPGVLNFLTTGYDGNAAPIGVADYWIWKFANQNGNDATDYSFWQHVRSTGTMQVGEGFTMKGPGTGGILTPQNYVFTGKPNNADISLTINAGNDYLVGNPYPSAIDSHEFLDDNPLTGGTLYFWEHWGGGSHVLGEYQGGYAQYNYSGGTGAASYGTNDPDVGTGGTPTKLPGRYIPVSQGFFVAGTANGTVNFENDQRSFVTEATASSVFVRNANAQRSYTEEVDTRMKFRIGFNSVNAIHRQLLLTVDDNATAGVDWGYDGVRKEDQIDDMYWMLDNDKYVIQGTNQVEVSTVVPLGLHTRDDGMNEITIDVLENVPADVEIFVHDNILDVFHDLRQSNYQVHLTAGEYLDRFSIVFNNDEPSLDIDDNDVSDTFEVHYANDEKNIVILNPTATQIEYLEIFNVIGQSIQSFEDVPNDVMTKLKVTNLSSGTYIIKLDTNLGTISKKVLVK